MNKDNQPSSFEAEQDRIRETKIFKRMISYLQGLADEKGFLARIKDLRKKCHLPENGLKKYIYVTMPANGHKVVTHPDYMDEVDYYKDLEKIADDYALDFFWVEYLEHYLVYGNFDIETMVFPIMISDVNEELNGPFQYDGEEEATLEAFKRTAKTHPIAIMVSPYASQQEIVDYVKKMHNISIRSHQLGYRRSDIKLGKIKRRDNTIRERNQFIIANKDLSSKKIATLVREKFGKVLDYTYINKIISDYEKK